MSSEPPGGGRSRREGPAEEVDPADPQSVRRAADASGLARLLGLELVEVAPGFAKARLIVREDHLNFYGHTHGAALFALADHVNSVASNTLGRRAVMINCSFNLFANPVVGQEIFATGRVTRAGKSLGYLEIEIHDDAGKRLCAKTTTVFFLDP